MQALPPLATVEEALERHHGAVRDDDFTAQAEEVAEYRHCVPLRCLETMDRSGALMSDICALAIGG